MSPNICMTITHKHHVLRQNAVNKARGIFLNFVAASNFTVACVVLLDSGGDSKNN